MDGDKKNMLKWCKIKCGIDGVNNREMECEN